MSVCQISLRFINNNFFKLQNYIISHFYSLGGSDVLCLCHGSLRVEELGTVDLEQCFPNFFLQGRFDFKNV